MASRLKVLGMENLVIERTEEVGDIWKNRYEEMRKVQGEMEEHEREVKRIYDEAGDRQYKLFMELIHSRWSLAPLCLPAQLGACIREKSSNSARR